MNKSLIATALAIGFCLPASAAQFTNVGDDRYDSPATVAEPNHAVNNREKASESQAMPITLIGDHAVYDSVSGDFHAEGNIKVFQGKQKIVTTAIVGNMKTGDVWLKEGGSLFDTTSETKAEWGHYNFNSKTGELKKLSGKNDKDLFFAPHAVIDPEKMTLDEGGITTRCSAVKHPKCLEIRAKKFEVYPGQKLAAYDVQVFVRGKHIYSRDYWENNLAEKNKERIMPHLGFKDEDKGFYINVSYERPIAKNTMFYADLNNYFKAGFKPMYGIDHDERNFKVSIQDGWDEQDDDWVKKQRDIRVDYKPHHFSDKLPLSYSAYYEHGLWKNENTGKESWHTEYGAYLNHDRIYLFNGNTSLDLTIGKKWTCESEVDTVESTNVYYATVNQKLTPKWNTWVGYYREDFTSNVFSYNQPDMPVELRNGISYRFDDKNIASIVNRYDLDSKANHETVYRWLHKFCCWQLVLEYTDEHYKNDSSLELKYEFTAF